jgi:hypothetical protein
MFTEIRSNVIFPKWELTRTRVTAALEVQTNSGIGASAGKSTRNSSKVLLGPALPTASN